jgi:hypothetical protein
MLFRFDEPRSAVSKYVSGWPNIYFSTSIDSNNKQSQDGRNVGERNLNETRKIHPKVINLSKQNLTKSEIKLLKNGLKFTPTPNEDKTLLGADIDVFCRPIAI